MSNTLSTSSKSKKLSPTNSTTTSNNQLSTTTSTASTHFAASAAIPTSSQALAVIPKTITTDKERAFTTIVTTLNTHSETIDFNKLQQCIMSQKCLNTQQSSVRQSPTSTALAFSSVDANTQLIITNLNILSADKAQLSRGLIFALAAIAMHYCATQESPSLSSGQLQSVIGAGTTACNNTAIKALIIFLPEIQQRAICTMYDNLKHTTNISEIRNSLVMKVEYKGNFFSSQNNYSAIVNCRAFTIKIGTAQSQAIVPSHKEIPLEPLTDDINQFTGRYSGHDAKVLQASIMQCSDINILDSLITQIGSDIINPEKVSCQDRREIWLVQRFLELAAPDSSQQHEISYNIRYTLSTIFNKSIFIGIFQSLFTVRTNVRVIASLVCTAQYDTRHLHHELFKQFSLKLDNAEDTIGANHNRLDIFQLLKNFSDHEAVMLLNSIGPKTIENCIIYTHTKYFTNDNVQRLLKLSNNANLNPAIKTLITGDWTQGYQDYVNNGSIQSLSKMTLIVAQQAHDRDVNWATKYQHLSDNQQIPQEIRDFITSKTQSTKLADQAKPVRTMLANYKQRIENEAQANADRLKNQRTLQATANHANRSTDRNPGAVIQLIENEDQANNDSLNRLTANANRSTDRNPGAVIQLQRGGSKPSNK